MSSNFQAVEFLAPIMVGILSVLDSPDVLALEVFAKKKKEKEKRCKNVSILTLCIKKEKQNGTNATSFTAPKPP